MKSNNSRKSYTGYANNNNLLDPADYSSHKIGILDPAGHQPNPLTGQAYSDTYKNLGKIWSQYPAYLKAEEIIKDIATNQVLLVISGTGSGKTVLVPKFTLHVLNYDEKIAITLPKQNSAESAAEFSAKTLDVQLGKEVGFKYKGSDKRMLSDSTKLLYATDGTVVAQLMKDPSLSDYSAVIIDEAHERKIQIDFLLYLLRNTLKLRPEFKLIIMSATINKELFTNYFEDFKFKAIELGGVTNYPITSIFLEKPITNKEYMKYGLEIIKKIEATNSSSPANSSNPEDILFFVTSANETRQTCDQINDNNKLGYCTELYAGLSQDKQKLALDKDSYKIISNKHRKIVTATNVAESSLTIDGIKYVIDSGYELLSSYDPILNARILEKKFVSQAQVIQRKGRAGRTSPGLCYHLYTKEEFDNKMKDFPEPAIRTSNLYDECIRLLHQPYIRTVDNLRDILNGFIEPPKTRFVNSALSLLTRLDLIEDDKISRLGDLVADLNIDPMQGLALILGYKLRCAKELCALFAILETTKNTIGDLFKKPGQKANAKEVSQYENARKRLVHEYGDHMTLLKIFQKYRDHKQANKPSQDLEPDSMTERTDSDLKAEDLAEEQTEDPEDVFDSEQDGGRRKKRQRDRDHAGRDRHTYQPHYSDPSSGKLGDIHKWARDNYIKLYVLDKANRTYQRTKDQVRRVLSRPNILENIFDFEDKLPDLNSKTLEHRIMLCILFGFRTNIANIKLKRFPPSRDSFINILNFKQYDDDVVYHELFIHNGRSETNIVSKIPSNIYASYRKLIK
jgi:HrpA-like RNA helicase